jgi:pimeloyl-ACP methyl ester carboxylesterase
MVAAVVAARRPRQVRALVLEDPPGNTLAGGFHQSRFHLQFTNIERLLADADTHDVERLTRALADMDVQHPGDGSLVRFGALRELAALRFGAECLLQMDPAVLTPLLAARWLEGLDWFGILPAIVCPTLLLRADPACGGMLETSEAARIAALIPRCTRVELPGASHSLHSSQPERMLELLAKFLEPQEVSSPRIQP